jgi:Bifunctional DNA primase/polymerase, N-terminal
MSATQSQPTTPQSAELKALGNLITTLIDEMPNATSADLENEFRIRYDYLANEKWNRPVDENTLWLEAQFKRALAKRATVAPPTTPEPAPESKTLLDWALWAAARGWYIFPCQVQGKFPITPNGYKDSTRDAEVIRKLWTAGTSTIMVKKIDGIDKNVTVPGNPNHNYGIDLGKSNLVVRDYDIVAPDPNMPPTFRVKTGRIVKEGEEGGYHDYYNGSCSTHSMFVPPVEPVIEKLESDKSGDKVAVRYDALGRKVGEHGVTVGEVRSRGSLVVGPGSIHKSGRSYEIISDIPLAESPEQNAEKVYDSGPAIGSDEQNTIAEFVEDAFEKSDVNYKAPAAYCGGFRWLIDCPWEHEHTGGKGISEGGSSSAVFMTAQGKLGYQCQHAHCENREWKELREWMEGKVGEKLPFGKPAPNTVLIAGELPARPPQPIANAIPAKTEAPVKEVTTPKTVAEAAEAAAAITTAALIAAEGWTAKPEDIIPPFDPTVINGIFAEIVELVTRDTTLAPQFVYANAKTIIGIKMCGKVKFADLDAEPRRYTALIGETGSGKGESWRRLMDVLYPRKSDVNENERQLMDRNNSCGIKIINSFDSGAGLKDHFFEPPENLPILCYIDEIAAFGNKGKDTKNPEIIDTIVELADSMSISRVLAKQRGNTSGTKTKRDARLCMVMCGQDGETYMKAFAGRTKIGLWDRFTPEFGVAVDPGKLPEVSQDDAVKMYAKIVLRDYSGTMTTSSDAEEMVNVFWSHQLPEVRKKVRWKKDLMLDAQLIAFGRESKVVELEDVERAIKTFTRQVVIRKVCFKNDASDRIGFYLGRIKDITASMQRQLDAGVEQSNVAKSRRDFERESNAYRDNETHIFDRAWKVHAPHWLKPVTITYSNGRKFDKFLPKPEDDGSN